MQSYFNAPQAKERRRRLRRRQTLTEKILWSQLRNRQVLGFKFYRQYGVGPYTLDFYCPAVRLAIELDGPGHAEPEAQRHDQRRTEYLGHFRIYVLRFWNDELLCNANRVMATIVDVLQQRASRK